MEDSDDYVKWYKWAYEQRYGKECEDGEMPAGIVPYSPKVRRYWDEEKALGILETDGKFIGVACLVAKEVVDKDSYIKRFGLSFEKDVQWHGISGVLDHLARCPMFKAVMVTTGKIPFELRPDVPEELEGRINWAKRNFEYHKEKADTIKMDIEQQAKSCVFGGPYPNFLPKQMKEEQDHSRHFLDATKGLEQQMQDHLKNYFLIKENLFAVALFFYIYTDTKDKPEDAIAEIESRKYSAKMEIVKTYFVRCSDVTDPNIAFNPEFFLIPMK